MWQPGQEMSPHKRAAAEQAVARIDRRHWISAGVGGDRGARGKDGFQEELQQRVAARETGCTRYVLARLTGNKRTAPPHRGDRGQLVQPMLRVELSVQTA